ncbi:MAG: helix-turn-helix transcriptional regulator [Gemmatimonadales bacterium]
MNERRTRKAGRRTRRTPFAPEARTSQASTEAVDRLARLLHVIPRAAAPRGVSLTDVAREIGVEVDVVLADLRELEEREIYQRPGSETLQIAIEAERVRVWTGRSFARPTKLSMLESLALWLGLEIVRISQDSEADARSDLAVRLLRHLAQPVDPDAAAVFAAPSSMHDPGGLRRTLSKAASERRVCEITYLKPGAEAAEARRVRPYVVIHAEGSWYVLAHCESAGTVRAFLVERVLANAVTDDRFERPADFNPDAYLDVDRTRVLEASGARHAIVRYSSVVARWLAERHEGEWTDDGAYIVRHPVKEPQWLVRTILQYAGEAEVLAPPDLRVAVTDAARAVVSFSSGVRRPERPAGGR